MSSEMPPNYSAQEGPSMSSSRSTPSLVIAPTAGAIQFQSGNLGVDGERTSVEGELQLKGFEAKDYSSITVTFRTVETTSSQTIELVSSEVVIYSRKDASNAFATESPLPETIAFSIPITSDVPQAIQTSVSSISHSLTATLHPVNPSDHPFSQTIPIQIKRFSSASYLSLDAAPRVLSIDQPSFISVQLPRAVFRVGEMIPVYVTIPPPPTSLTDGGLQLRNIKTELIRVVKVGPVKAKAPEVVLGKSASFRVSKAVKLSDALSPNGYPLEKRSRDLEPPPLDTPIPSTSSSSSSTENVYQTIITRSGASCRFNARQAVQLRLILHSPSMSQLDSQDESMPPDVDSAAGSITQSTVLHQISFFVRFEVSFVTPATHISSRAEGSIPIVVVPPLAQQPEMLEDLESSYMKKHDKPPSKTTRADEAGLPSFDDADEGVQSLSLPSASVDPPPFSSIPFTPGLPSFSESQGEPSGSGPSQLEEQPQEIRFPGEGTQFGFAPEEQYDGLSHASMVNRSATPPPAISSSSEDTNVTALAAYIGQARINENRETMAASSGFMHPPPPPAMDDPMDPPPSIDDRFSQVNVATVQVALGSPPRNTATPTSVPVGPPPYLGASSTAPLAPPSYIE